MTTIYSKEVLPVSEKPLSESELDRLRRFFEILIAVDRRTRASTK